MAMGVHPITVTKWHDAGVPIRKPGSKGRAALYSEADVRAWREAREEAAAQATPDILNATAERARRDRAQARWTEASLKIRMRDLLPREEVERAWAAEIVAVRSVILSIPMTHGDRLWQAAGRGQEAFDRELEDAMNDILRELAGPNRPIVPAVPDAVPT